MKKYVNIAIFFGIIFSFFILYICEIGGSVWGNVTDSSITISGKIENINNLYSEADVFQEQWINLYGMSERVLGKQTIENFTIYKTDYGKLQSPRKPVAEQDVDASIENIKLVYEYLEENKIPVYYMTSLLPIADQNDLMGGIEDHSQVNARELELRLEDVGIPVIDLRSEEKILEIGKEDLFYRTDHHWALETCFAAFQETIEHLENELAWGLDPEGIYTDVDNYEIYIDNASFLGSYGIKVGKYYAGKDDFVVYIPEFDTELVFEAYDSEHNRIMTKEGKFEDALMDWNVVSDDNYNNKYNSFSNGCSVETRFINKKALNDKKVLLIAHSYGRPFAQYLSLCFEQTRHIDVQAGRYNDDCLLYIEEYNPDLVLIMTEFEGDLNIRIPVGTK